MTATPDPLEHAEVILADAYSLVEWDVPLKQKIEQVLKDHQEEPPNYTAEYWAAVKSHLSSGRLTEKYVSPGDRLRTKQQP